MTSMDLVDGSYGQFVSASQLLVGPDVVPGDCRPPQQCHNDDDLVVYWPGLGPNPADDEPNDRTHRATVDGSLVVRYEPGPPGVVAEAEVPVCRRSPEERRVLRVRFHVWNEPIGVDVNGDHIFGATVLGTEKEAEEWVAEQLRRARSAWAPACIRIEQVGEVMFEDGKADDVITMTNLGFIIGDWIASNADADVIEVYFVGIFDARNSIELEAAGLTVSPSDADSGWHTGNKTLVLLPSVLRFHDNSSAGFDDYRVSRAVPCLAHEIGHALTNSNRDTFPGSDVLTNPPYVFYPGGELEIGNDNWNGPRRITHETAERARRTRPAGDMKAVGNGLLRQPSSAGR